ncbi:MAG: 1-acyl-sn-glycerol-3-phosphate acyltransferase, partial [Myxococcales bacterium]|nr:1-acyl-sn-glycerol-3-phosphate acyltransferase [Myxococcales bacterium]
MSLFNDEQIRQQVERLPIPFDAYGVDPFGISKRHLIRAYSPFARMYRSYLNVTVFGGEHIPERGRGLVIGNHSGGVGADAAMVFTSLLLNPTHPRLGHGMAEYFFNTKPYAGLLLSRLGHLTGLPEHAEMLLEAERLVVAFPEGQRGALKLYKHRYQLERFGTGFMRLALKKKTPIIPFAFIGGEEAFPIVHKFDFVTKLIGTPALPVAPQLVLWPLPVSCQIYYGEPMRFEGDGSEPDDVIAGYVGEVKDTIRALIARGLAARPAAFTRKRVEHAPPLEPSAVAPAARRATRSPAPPRRSEPAPPP